MTTYKDSGVDIEAGDKASRAAYTNAKTTFNSRQDKIGQPYILNDGFAGALDMGDYLLIQNDDGTGSKSDIATAIEKYDTLGYDLCAMVADDAICVGAEVISLSNTFDVPHIDADQIDALTKSLAQACSEQQIVIPGGEIAEVPSSVKQIVWNATAMGVVKKDRFITGQTIQPDQSIIGLYDPMLRSNGFSLARKILSDNFGTDYAQTPYDQNQSWGEVLLTPSKIFHRLLLDHVIGGFEEDRPFTVHGVCHITGGGIQGNLCRILPNSIGANLSNLHTPPLPLQKLKELGQVSDTEAYHTWHSGTAMMLIVEPHDAEQICQTLNQADASVRAKVVGTTNDTGEIRFSSQY